MLPQNDVALRELYDVFNDRYFEGKLPRSINVHFSNRLKWGITGMTLGRAGRTFLSGYFIRINARLKVQEQIRIPFVLMHEMIHIHQYVTKGWGGHGLDFQDKARQIYSRFGVLISFKGKTFPVQGQNSWLTMTMNWERMKPNSSTAVAGSTPTSEPTANRNQMIDSMVKSGLVNAEIIQAVAKRYPEVSLLKIKRHVWSRSYALRPR